METQLKSLIEKYCLNSNLTDNQLDEIIDLALETKANPKEVEEYIQEKTEERKARIETERKAKEEAEHKAEAERKAKEEAERKANEERIKQKVEEFSGSARKRAAQLFNDVITEMGTIENRAVKGYKRRLRAEAMDAFAHRNDSPEAAEYNRVLWEEYNKVVIAVQSGRVETMEDLKCELERESNRSSQTETISQQNDSANKQEVSETKAKEEAECKERERLAAIEQEKRETEDAERKAKEAIERAKREKEEAERQAKEEAERKAKEEAAKKAAAPSASISDVRIVKDVTRDGKLGIQVVAHFVVNGMKGETAIVAVHNISDLEQQVLTFTKKPVFVLNNVYQDKLTIPYTNTEWKEYKLFISYESLLDKEEELDKTLHLLVQNVIDGNKNILAQYKILYHIKYVSHIFRANEWFFTLKK